MITERSRRYSTVRFPLAQVARPGVEHGQRDRAQTSTAVALDSLIEKKSPGDGARFWSLSCTMTSKRHNGEVGVSLRRARRSGSPPATDDVRPVAAQEDQLVLRPGRRVLADADLGFQHWVDRVD